jgi:hypothetical protein
MSDPFLDPPEVASYIIDPEKQCGVLKPNGYRCTTRLNCRFHADVEKRAVDRSETYERLLKRQAGRLAFDIRHSGYHVGQGKHALVFDPDIRCGVDLPTGEFCPQDLLLCETHTCEQQSNVQGRSVSFEGLLRVNKANASRGREKDGLDSEKYNPDTDCGAIKADGEYCQDMLSCTIHGEDVKRSVWRYPPFANNLDLLWHLQVWRMSVYELDEVYMCNPEEQDNDGQVDPILSGSGESQASGGEFSTGNDKVDVQGDNGDARPVTPSRSSRGNTNTTSPDQTATAPSPKTPRELVSLPSLFTSDDEQLTPASSKNSLNSDSDDGSREDTVEGSKADLDSQEAQLEQGWAQLRHDQARQKLQETQLQDDRYRLETQLLQDRARQDREKAQLYDQDAENRRAAQLRYDQIAATLDRHVHEQQATGLEATRLRERARRADELEQAHNVQRGYKASMLQSLKDLKVGSKNRDTLHQNEIILYTSQYSALLEMQVRGVQQSIEVLLTEKANATTCYQQDKLLWEAEINKLQENINALLV